MDILDNLLTEMFKIWVRFFEGNMGGSKFRTTCMGQSLSSIDSQSLSVFNKHKKSQQSFF